MRTVQRFCLLVFFVPTLAFAECEVMGGDFEAFDAAMAQKCAKIFFSANTEGERQFVVPAPMSNADYRYVIDWNLELEADDGLSRVEFEPSMPAQQSFGFADVQDDVTLTLRNIRFSNFGSAENGGTLQLNGGKLWMKDGRIRDSWSGGYGGAIAARGDSDVFLSGVQLKFNHAEFGGGHVAFHGNSTGTLFANKFYEGTVGNGAFGYALDVNTTGINEYGVAVKSLTNSYYSSQDINMGDFRASFLSLGDSVSFETSAYHAVAPVSTGGTIFFRPSLSFSPERSRDGGDKSRLQVACDDFGTNAFTSLGYNISPDDSCNLDQPSDQPNTEAMMDLSEFGWVIPQPGSPAIDGGFEDVIVQPGEPLALPPCPTIDGRGTARPQDGDGDGNFECDLGAIEAVGVGTVLPAHSGAYYNVNRNGEGSYVEILSDTLAVVYTFTYQPDGSGPAWFLGLATLEDNAIVALELQRPIGTEWGGAFDAAEISRDPAGAMNMVFPTCRVSGNSGNAAFTGHPDLGYEGLVSRMSRASQVIGCGIAPSARAGLSGSFYDPARDGEGLIVEWLPDGRVLVIMFTYGPDGSQQWLTGQGVAVGDSVEIDVQYPAASTSWGRNFNPNEINLLPWGTFTLTWTDCNTLVFDYDSTVSGYGSGTLNYRRLTRLAGTSCPT